MNDFIDANDTTTSANMRFVSTKSEQAQINTMIGFDVMDAPLFWHRCTKLMVQSIRTRVITCLLKLSASI